MAGRRLNALVLGVGGNVSQSIQKALALGSTPTRVVAACISPHSPGLYVADRAYISPLAASPEFIPWLLDVCEREQIDVVLSGSEVVLDALAREANAIHDQTGAVCIVSPPDVLSIGRDKLLTCRWLEERGLPVPDYAGVFDEPAVRALVQRRGFPLVAKPRFGKGGDGIVILRDESDLGRLVAAEDLSLREIVGRRLAASDLILQQYLGSEHDEYTAGCFIDSNRRLRGTIVMRRKLLAGTTAVAELGRFDAVRDVAASVATELAPLGPCNVQLRCHEGLAIPFEINPRFSGTTAMRARMGFNEVDAAVRHFGLGQPIEDLTDVGSGVALRYWNEVYVPAEAVRTAGERGYLVDPPSEKITVEAWGFGP